jgi:hypothetical protein
MRQADILSRAAPCALPSTKDDCGGVNTRRLFEPNIPVTLLGDGISRAGGWPPLHVESGHPVTSLAVQFEEGLRIGQHLEPISGLGQGAGPVLCARHPRVPWGSHEERMLRSFVVSGTGVDVVGSGDGRNVKSSGLNVRVRAPYSRM